MFALNNITAIRLLKEAIVLDKKKYKTYHDLDQLTGTWSEEEYNQFHKSIEEFERIEKEIWK